MGATGAVKEHMMNKIKFVYLGQEYFNTHERPRPSKTYIPEWFKNMPPYSPSENDPEGKKIIVEDGESNATAKKCTPMLDGITTGYTITLWADIQIRNIDGYPRITWRTSQNIFEMHGNYGAPLVPPPTGYANIVLKYLTRFKIETPKGYSIMIRNPAGHNDLPFYAIPAIIDSDKSVIDNNIPVWIKKDFEGIVEKGTPIAQVIPFKRESWQSEFSWISEQQHKENEEKTFKSNLVNHYVRNIWSKKDFR